MPEFDISILEGIKGLDEIMGKLPRYMVTFKKPVFSLPFKSIAKICVYVGYWHSLDGWNYEDKDIADWEYIGEYDSYVNPIRFPEKELPYVPECGRFCDICYGCSECLIRRGVLFDTEKNEFVLTEDGNYISSGKRKCDKGVDEMIYITHPRYRHLINDVMGGNENGIH